ncbi:MAG: hypothetical protein P1U53_17955, partial [Sulfitobacter sp.]|nr:hypothetical protein [Sulfitobacter sp.]
VLGLILSLEEARVHELSCVVTLFDLAKAFPSMMQEMQVGRLEDAGVRGRAARLVDRLTSEATVYVRHGPLTSESANMGVGVVEGAPTSPVVYVLSTGNLVRAVLDAHQRTAAGHGVDAVHSLSGRVDGHVDVLFADDHGVADIHDPSSGGLTIVQRGRATCLGVSEYNRQHLLTSNVGKSLSLRALRGSAEEILRQSDGLARVSVLGPDREPIPVVTQAKYLGAQLVSGGASASSDANWEVASRRTASALREVVWKVGFGVVHPRIARVHWLMYYGPRVYHAIGAWACTPAPAAVAASHATAMSITLGTPYAPPLMVLRVAGLLPHWGLVSEARVRLLVQAMERGDSSTLRRKVGRGWRALRRGDLRRSPWFDCLLECIEQVTPDGAERPVAEQLARASVPTVWQMLRLWARIWTWLTAVTGVF